MRTILVLALFGRLLTRPMEMHLASRYRAFRMWGYRPIIAAWYATWKFPQCPDCTRPMHVTEDDTWECGNCLDDICEECGVNPVWEDYSERFCSSCWYTLLEPDSEDN